MSEENTLLPCPFCGDAPKVERYDRLISVSCAPCGYSRGFSGLLQSKPSPVKVSDSEFYHPDAHNDAAMAWNCRAQTNQNHPSDAEAISLALEALEKERQNASGRRDFSMLSIRAIETLKEAFSARAAEGA